MRRLLLAALLVAGCGGDDGPDPRLRLTTPPPRIGAEAIRTPLPTPLPGERAPTAADARRLRPVIAAWGRALTRGDAAAAARFFELPAIVFQSRVLEFSTRREIEAFHRALPCGATVEEVQQDGRYIVATFRLKQRRGAVCGDDGELVRVAFVFHGRRFSEWWQVPDARGAAPGPPEPPSTARGP